MAESQRSCCEDALLLGVVAGEVTYRSKFLKSETYKKNIKADRIVVSEFGTMIYPDPCKNIFSRYRRSRTGRGLLQCVRAFTGQRAESQSFGAKCNGAAESLESVTNSSNPHRPFPVISQCRTH